MAKTQKNQQPATSSPTAVSTSLPRALVLLASLAGLVVTAILLAGGDAELPYCNAGSGCDLVQNSPWSTFFGVPLALLGLCAYSVMLLSVIVRPGAGSARTLVFTAGAGFVISVYLTVISGTVIRAYCLYCLGSLGLMTLVFAVSWLGFRQYRAGRIRIAGVALGAAIAALMHVDATGDNALAGPVDPHLQALAEHLTARGAKFYGASWCPHCQEQKALFGAAAVYLPYVECSPHGQRGPQATECVTRDIRNYPTWIIDGRRVERILPVPALESLSAFSAPDG